MCKWGTDIKVTLCEPMPNSKRTTIKVDACLAPLIQALNDYGIKTMASCCGHGKTEKSFIRLSSRNVLITKFGDEYSIHLEFPHMKNMKDLTALWLNIGEILTEGK